jgi:hypothetical protein
MEVPIVEPAQQPGTLDIESLIKARIQDAIADLVPQQHDLMNHE